jgi:hypothetical protein
MLVYNDHNRRKRLQGVNEVIRKFLSMYDGMTGSLRLLIRAVGYQWLWWRGRCYALGLGLADLIRRVRDRLLGCKKRVMALTNPPKRVSECL